MSDRFVVRTEYGLVLVSINPASTSGFDPELLLLDAVTDNAAADIGMEVPLRAFAAKMVELVEAAGTTGSGIPAGMIEMMVSEKATSDLRRIERWAKENQGT
jgi:hypothetical protein